MAGPCFAAPIIAGVQFVQLRRAATPSRPARLSVGRLSPSLSRPVRASRRLNTVMAAGEFEIPALDHASFSHLSHVL
jgi:hypothetical protein